MPEDRYSPRDYRQLIEHWVPLFGLRHWELSFEWVGESRIVDTDRGQVYGQSFIQAEEQRAHIRIMADRPKSDVLRTLLHELTHVLHSETELVCQIMGEAMSEELQKRTRQLLEVATERLAMRIPTIVMEEWPSGHKPEGY